MPFKQQNASSPSFFLLFSINPESRRRKHLNILQILIIKFLKNTLKLNIKSPLDKLSLKSPKLSKRTKKKKEKNDLKDKK